ncbi:hypothetical protein NDU88_005967 [Pleurodeles waltl]|uniref:Uncharacterized protein n=1 Tax=Pleurodeles waltl TaxID=8319 RepID=A0AAV7RNL9_PLEWA|nr:hypothetical protein NDU88_005967 [Pleurodeles waltl]
MQVLEPDQTDDQLTRPQQWEHKMLPVGDVKLACPRVRPTLGPLPKTPARLRAAGTTRNRPWFWQMVGSKL